MFAKPYKLKSNNTLKNSEKKHLVQRIQDAFPSASAERVKELVPAKSSCSCMKLVVHSGETVGVFVVDGEPVLLEAGGGLVPTVCALWRLPELLPTITIHAPVLPKIAGGAPLYLPGVSIPAGGAGFPLFPRGALLAARTPSSPAGVVGRALLSSADMLLRPSGVCMETIHVLGDQLCKDAKFVKIELPKVAPPCPAPAVLDLTADFGQLSCRPPAEEWPALGPARPAPAPHRPGLIADTPHAPPTPATAATATTPPGDADSSPVEEEDDDPKEGEDMDMEKEYEYPEDMDGLLRWCLLTFIQLEGKSVELPLKTNLLYRNHMVPLCPPERTLDVKKSSYKKMSKFLDAMQQEGLLEVRELERGVDGVVALSAQHELLRAHRPPPGLRARLHPPTAHERDTDYEPPQIREVYCVTAAVLPLFPEAKKGSAMTSGEVRSALVEYVRARSLDQRGAVRLDAPLAAAAGLKDQEVVKWDALMEAVRARMTAGTELCAGGVVRLVRARLPPVRMSTHTRSGNKKVTLVSNLEAYGFSLPPLARACQLGVGASCGVTRAPGAACDQLMLQGDQTHFVAKLLIEKYGLPKKFVEGADKALNKKK